MRSLWAASSGFDRAEEVPRELLGDLLERRHVAAKDLRPVVRPRQTLRGGPLEMGAVRADQVVEVLLRDRLACGPGTSRPRRRRRCRARRARRSTGPPASPPAAAPRTSRSPSGRRSAAPRTGPVARVAREEGLDLREVLALGLGELPRQLLDPLRSLLSGSLALLGLERPLEASRLALLLAHVPGDPPRLRILERGARRRHRARHEQRLLGLDRGEGLELVPLRPVSLVQAKQHARQGIEHRQAVGRLEVLGPGLLAGQGSRQAPDDRRRLMIGGRRLDPLAVPLVEPAEEVRGAPVDLGQPASSQHQDGPLEGRLRSRQVARLPVHDAEVVEEQADPGMGRPERRLGDLEGALEVVPGEDVVPERLRDPRPVPERLGKLGVGRAERLLLDPQRALDQRQGPLVVSALPQDVRERGQGPRDARMVGPERLLPDRQGALDERARLRVVVQPLVERAVVGQDVARDRDARGPAPAPGCEARARMSCAPGHTRRGPGRAGRDGQASGRCEGDSVRACAPGSGAPARGWRAPPGRPGRAGPSPAR